MDQEIKLYTRIEDREQAVALIEAAEVLIAKAEKYEKIETDADAELVGEYRARVNQHMKDLEKERLEMGSGLRDTLDRINAKFNGHIATLKEKLARTDFVLRKYLTDKRERDEAERREAERKVREEQERRDAEQRAVEAEAAQLGIEPPPPLPAPIVEAPPPVSSGLTGRYGSKVATRDNWKYRVVNIKKVPDQYLLPPEERVNKSVLNALARSQKDKASVPGIEFYSEESIASRVVR